MRDTIYTIPLSDVFGPKEGCPVCRLHDMLEKRCVEYIMGAAMMEPDIRIETNRYGFCRDHLAQMAAQKNRLSLALMLETHLDELLKKHIPSQRKKGESAPSETCFVCREIDGAMQKLLGTAVKLYITDPSFRTLFHEQEFYCLGHYDLLCGLAAQELGRKQAAVFVDGLSEKMRADVTALRGDVHAFSTMFDYRNAGKPIEDDNVKYSVERAIRFLE